MITQREIKHLCSLHTKKFRQQHKTFLVQGKKLVEEVLRSTWTVNRVYCLSGEEDGLFAAFGLGEDLLCTVSERQLNKISTLKTPNVMLAEVAMPDTEARLVFDEGWHLYLDGIKDPGNMGTVLRIADRFGIASVLCSQECVEIFNPKVVQSTMGSLFRVPFVIGATPASIEAYKAKDIPVLAAQMDGTDLYASPMPDNTLLVLGNESHGISDVVNALVDRSLTIPNFGNAESLNVAIAAAVFCSEYRARGYRD